MCVGPAMMSKEQHAKQKRWCAAYEKVFAEATSEERDHHNWKGEASRYAVWAQGPSEIDRRVIALLETGWQPEDMPVGNENKFVNCCAENMPQNGFLVETGKDNGQEARRSGSKGSE